MITGGRSGTGLIQVVGLYWKIIAYMAPLDPKLIHARLMDPEKVVGLCLQIVKVVWLKPHQPHRLCRPWEFDDKTHLCLCTSTLCILRAVIRFNTQLPLLF